MRTYMDNYTPDPFWNNQNQDSNKSSDNSQQNYGSYTDDYSNDPDKEYTSYSDNENAQNSQSDSSDYNNYDSQNGYNTGYNNYDSQNNYNTGYNNYDSQNNYNTGYNNYNKPQNCPKFTPLLVFSIICIILFSRLFGIIALILLFNANNNFRYGRYDKYESCIKICTIMLVISVIVGISWTVIIGIASYAFDAIR